jgi:hypothetical protein
MMATKIAQTSSEPSSKLKPIKKKSKKKRKRKKIPKDRLRLKQQLK